MMVRQGYTCQNGSVERIYSPERIDKRVRRRNEDERMLSLLTAGTAQGGGMIMIVYLVLIIGFFYFFLMRPQKKEQKRVAGMLASMEIGDVVCTTGGFYGVLIDITDDTVIVEFGNNKNCRIPMKKEAIADVEKAES